MLYQIHHQNKKDRSKTEFLAQSDIENEEQYKKFVRETQEKFPLPEGFDWLFCNEKSEYFIKTVVENQQDVACAMGGDPKKQFDSGVSGTLKEL